jgi:hypothetical protein
MNRLNIIRMIINLIFSLFYYILLGSTGHPSHGSTDLSLGGYVRVTGVNGCARSTTGLYGRIRGVKKGIRVRNGSTPRDTWDTQIRGYMDTGYGVHGDVGYVRHVDTWGRVLNG